MKKIIVFLILFVLILSGCSKGSVDVEVLPDPAESVISNDATESTIEYIELEPSESPYEEVLASYFDLTISYTPGLSKDENIAERERIENYVLTLYENTLAEISEEQLEEAIKMIHEEIDRVLEFYNAYQEEYDLIIEQEAEAAKWQERMDEYPTATTVWKYLTETMEYNDYVAAGVLGNMMAECGGQTLKLNWKARNATGHYGLCQWSTGFIKVQGADLQGQLDFMAESFSKQIDRWGGICYKKGFTYAEFLEMEDAEEAAYAFCVIYERPGPGTYNQRRANALKAFEYFTS